VVVVESRIEPRADLPGLVAEVADVVAASLDASGLELRFVVLDAQTGSQAWTEDVDGVPTSFLAAERFPAGDVGVCLVAHEAAHAVHHRVRPEPWPVTVATKLFEEAVAIGVSRAVAPGIAEVDAASFGSLPEAWLAECDAAWPATRAVLAAAVAGGGEESGGEGLFAELFARPERRPADAELPVRCGYAAALRLAPALGRMAPAADLVRLEAQAAIELVAAVLEDA
jgi:hypothetical protein